MRTWGGVSHIPPKCLDFIIFVHLFFSSTLQSTDHFRDSCRSHSRFLVGHAPSTIGVPRVVKRQHRGACHANWQIGGLARDISDSRVRRPVQFL